MEQPGEVWVIVTGLDGTRQHSSDPNTPGCFNCAQCGSFRVTAVP